MRPSARYRPRKFLTFCLNDCFAALQIVCPPELADWRISPRLIVSSAVAKALADKSVYWLIPFISVPRFKADKSTAYLFGLTVVILPSGSCHTNVPFRE